MAARPLAVLVAVVGVLLVAPVVNGAALPVVDALADANALLEMVRLVEMVNLGIRDLAPLAEISEAVGVAADLQIILTASQTIASQIHGRRGVWGRTGTLPTTTRAFAEMRRTHTALCRLTATQGLQAQSLVGQIPMLLNRLTKLLESASRILGTVAGLQAASAVLGEVSGQLAVLTITETAAQEPQLCEIWARRLEEQALESVSQVLLRDYAQLPEQP